MKTIKDFLAKRKFNLKGFILKTSLMAASLYTTTALAAIPTVESNSDGVGSGGGAFAFLTGWIKDILVWTPLVLMSGATLWVAWALLQKVLAERQLEKPNWGAIGIHTIASILLLVVTVYLGNETINVWA
ncbi:hypothetical protein DS885_03775 [Psychromonas sp. B3M02]|uniref:DUF2976 domain-containing protein n=1 Tax=Psychromonas sp. B3M02 TaxID=2267226 RepID=UPI000DE944D2|nr:DUF2976 domain-containing protein [Psychromonas sp. B3M02]RBW47275.1 hypothetical protein DS885_03775 [Psychromonas sp. B3M02]